MLAVAAACTQQQGMSSLGHFVPAHPGQEQGSSHLVLPHQPATCGSGQASDNDPFSSHTYGLQSMCAQLGLTCISRPYYAPLSQILKTEARRVNDLPNVNVLEPDVETRCSAEVSNPRLLLFPTDPFLISHCLRSVMQVRRKKTQAGKSSCTAVLGG